jgi:uncharacterized membrane protein YuzA (DUF378 family)
MAKMKLIDKLATILLLVGGISWGLVALFSFDLITWIAGFTFTALDVILKVLIGVAAAYCLLGYKRLFR